MTDDPAGTDHDDVLDGNASAGQLARRVRRGHDGRPRASARIAVRCT